MSTINLSNNILLEQLSVNGTNLTSLDVSTNTALGILFINNTSLEELYCVNNPNLSSLNIKNGNNTNVTLFNATNNPNLSCIEVDDEVYSNLNWPDKDISASYNNDCNNLSITVEENITFKIYPNPVNDIINLRSKSSINTIEIYNLQGKNIATFKLSKIDVSFLTPGVYILKLKSNDSEVFKRIIKK